MEEVEDSLEVQMNEQLQFVLATIWNKMSQDNDLSEMKQSRGQTENSITPTAETEAKKHEVQEMSVMDDGGIFQVTKWNIHVRTCSRTCACLREGRKYMEAGLLTAVN
jgi:hypothetical protein